MGHVLLMVSKIFQCFNRTAAEDMCPLFAVYLCLLILEVVQYNTENPLDVPRTLQQERM